MMKICLAFLLGAFLGISPGAAQGSDTTVKENSASGVPTIHYAMVGESGGLQVVIDLDKFVLQWFEENVGRFDQMAQAEKDEVARRLITDESLDFVDIRLENRGNKSMSMNVTGDTLTVSFKKVRAKYSPDIEDSGYPTELLADSQAEVRFPIATTTDAKLGIGRLAASLSRIDFLLRKDLNREHAADFSQANQDPTERPEVRMAPIARSILEQDLFGEFFLANEGVTVPLVFRISTADVDAPAFR
jgi:hypothetical protein